MSNHTPGPWSVMNGLVYSIEPNGYANRVEIASANAKLIAAAPALVEALQAIARYGVEADEWDAVERYSAVLRLAREALVKAGVS